MVTNLVEVGRVSRSHRQHDGVRWLWQTKPVNHGGWHYLSPQWSVNSLHGKTWMEFSSLLLLAQIKEKNVSIVRFNLFNTAIVWNAMKMQWDRTLHLIIVSVALTLGLSGDLSWLPGQVLQILARWCRVVRRLQGHVRGGGASCWICGSHIYSGEGEWKLGLMHRECWCILPPVIADITE